MIIHVFFGCISEKKNRKQTRSLNNFISLSPIFLDHQSISFVPIMDESIFLVILMVIYRNMAYSIKVLASIPPNKTGLLKEKIVTYWKLPVLSCSPPMFPIIFV